MTKQHNILGERPRKRNNKKIKASKAFDMKRAFENVIAIDTAHNDMVDSTAYMMLNIGLCEKPQPMSKVQAFIIIALTLLAFVGLFRLTQRAMDIHTLNTCEMYGDCSEVIRAINE